MVGTHLPSNILPLIGAADADTAPRDSGPAGAVQPQPDGRTDETVRTSWPCEPKRALGGSWNHGRGSYDRRGDEPTIRRLHVCKPRSDQPPFFIAGTLKITYDLLLYRGLRRRSTAGGGSSIREGDNKAIEHNGHVRLIHTVRGVGFVLKEGQD